MKENFQAKKEVKILEEIGTLMDSE